ncbi:DegT/DnrJ/EryC1/StrS aminotransferase [Chthoniobacter flavus Ellin428]|uniref:DegT/DnrJ/EryC1/StrS aminotransferase n=1 Tax=Chthoniobacter flavus Ellin428 TaxID=497964 RepID=B4CZT1_9BACT|nr:DegT/DnrJ/EryC1/StrS family aminotransferase [Chthoniobacter flavus]EDY20245.1 DegT/DnrJ/EryC1/StrS aminotransferase [Chthoniobacter flavus Ellin428]TCO94142.1 dTDP-4-amino-4,6-dideoxygalactose transaminase [Chthoniobacter flavus]
MQVPLLDLKLQYAPLKAQLLREIEAVADSQALLLGPQTEKLEKAVADYCGAGHAIGASSGTDAQLMLLMALGIGPGDKVLTTPYTFFATASCVARLGATPVFVDIDPVTFNISVPALETTLARTPDAKGIIPVHLYGQCADMEAIVALGKKYGIPVLEDAAQALGARHPLGGAGAIGEAGWFSFYPTKNLGAFGDAGMVVCRDEKLAVKIRALRNHGMEVRYYHKWIGGNFRIDAIQSAVLNVKLPHLDTWSAGRRARADFYRTALSRHALPITLPTEVYADAGLPNHHIYNQFIVRAPKRDELRAHLTKAGIGSEIYYPLPLHMQECFAYLGYEEGEFPEAERAARESLALPIFPELTEEQQTYVVEQIAAFYR